MRNRQEGKQNSIYVKNRQEENQGDKYMNKDMSLKRIGEQLILFEKENQNKTFRVNNKQMGKFKYAKKVFFKLFMENGGDLEIVDNSNDLHSSITYTTYSISLIGQELLRLTNVLKFASTIGIDATIDGKACICIVIPDTRIMD